MDIGIQGGWAGREGKKEEWRNEEVRGVPPGTVARQLRGGGGER